MPGMDRANPHWLPAGGIDGLVTRSRCTASPCRLSNSVTLRQVKLPSADRDQSSVCWKEKGDQAGGLSLDLSRDYARVLCRTRTHNPNDGIAAGALMGEVGPDKQLGLKPAADLRSPLSLHYGG
jgi:hypothetical protein